MHRRSELIRVQDEIESAIKKCKHSIKNKEFFHFSDLEVNILLERKSNLESALEIIKNTK